MNILESEVIYTFYAGANDTVKITCPKCGTTKSYDAKDFIAPYRGIKAKCTCGEIFRCVVEFRRYYRKCVNLSGKFTNRATGKAGMITIESISMGGIDFFNVTPECTIAKDDILDVAFYLDDTVQTLIQRQVRVKSVEAETIRALFVQPQLYDKELGFYLLP